MTCLCCGKCCTAVIMYAHQTHDWFRARAQDNALPESERVDAAFIADHWELIKVQRDRENNDAIVARMYRCRMIGPDNRCTCYDVRPPVCRGYPHYDGRVEVIEKIEGTVRAPSQVRLHPGCGYSVKP